MHYYLDVLKKYAVFEGRASRKEYWMFVLANFIVGFILGIISGIVKVALKVDISLVIDIYQLAIIIPSISVAVRRMHDVNKNGWYIIIPFYNLVLACTAGTQGMNNYGADPKEVSISQGV